MRKLLFIFALPALLFGADTIGTWAAAANGRMDSIAAYTWNPSAPGSFSTDVILRFDSTSDFNATAGADMSVKRVVTTADYGGVWSISSRTLTVADSFFVDGTGALNLGNGITNNGASGIVHIGSGVGAVTATSCVLTMNTATAGVIDIDKACVLKGLMVAANAVVVDGSAALLDFESNVTPIILGDNCTMTNNNKTNLWRIKCTASMSILSIGSDVTLNGTGGFIFHGSTNGITLTIPAITYTGTGSWQFDIRTLGVSVTFTMAGDFTGTSILATNFFKIVTINGTLLTFNTANYNINVPLANFYATSSTDAIGFVLNCGSSTITAGKCVADYFVITSTTINMQTSTWSIGGVFTFGSGWTINPGTSTVTITNTSTITTANKTCFYDLIINADTKTVTFADSLKLAAGGDYLITAGNVTHSTKTICSQGDIINNSTGTFVWPTSVCLKGTNYNMHIDAACGVQTMESTVFAPTRSGTIDIDKVDTLGPITALDSVRTTIGGAGNAVYSVLSAKNFTTTDSLTIDSLYMPDSAGVVLKSAAGTRVNKTTAALLSGAAGKLNRYTASTPGSAARLFLPAEYTLSYVSLTDITVSPAQVADATSVNGGGNTGWTFQTGTTTRRRGGGGLRLNGGLDLGL